MREILFRGKRCDNGEWVQGFYVRADHHWHNNGIHKDWIICGASANGGWFALHNKYAVKSETVGQFTGLTDKNGKKIFEGDIVHVLGNQQVEDWKNVNYIGSIAFLDAGFCVIDGTVEEHGFRRYGLPRLDFDLEVIGNIHDNPEPLEEGAEDG
jgi:uncharacterized phage protein (TIGR01671 family)